MARSSLMREVSLERLVATRRVKFECRGADVVGLCPFHDDREPSFVVTPSKNLWHCVESRRRLGD